MIGSQSGKLAGPLGLTPWLYAVPLVGPVLAVADAAWTTQDVRSSTPTVSPPEDQAAVLLAQQQQLYALQQQGQEQERRWTWVPWAVGGVALAGAAWWFGGRRRA